MTDLQEDQESPVDAPERIRFPNDLPPDTPDLVRMEDMVRRHPLLPYCNDRERELVGFRSALIVKGLLHREACISDAEDMLPLELPISDQCNLPASDVQASPTSMGPEDFPLALPTLG